ncbi:MAG: DUF928 domain-containing protein [Cyanophyceae cyanobacterium]
MLERSHFGKALPIICIASLLTVFSVCPAPVALASTYQSRKTVAEPEEPIPLPSRRAGGGTRRETCISQNSLVALIPNESVSLTTSPSPTLFLRLPRADQQQTVEFVLRNQEDQLVYDTIFSASGKQGIISVKIASTAQPLKVNRDYHWYLSIICNPDNRAEDVVVEGIIRRVELEQVAISRLSRLSPLEQAAFYQEANIWHEALATLAQAKSLQSDKAIADQWVELLRSVGLETVAKDPFIRTVGFSQHQLAEPTTFISPATEISSGPSSIQFYSEQLSELERLLNYQQEAELLQ